MQKIQELRQLVKQRQEKQDQKQQVNVDSMQDRLNELERLQPVDVDLMIREGYSNRDIIKMQREFAEAQHIILPLRKIVSEMREELSKQGTGDIKLVSKLNNNIGSLIRTTRQIAKHRINGTRPPSNEVAVRDSMVRAMNGYVQTLARGDASIQNLGNLIIKECSA